LISFTITLMVDWPAPQIALDLQKGARFAYSQLDHGPSWRCAGGDHRRSDTLRVIFRPRGACELGPLFPQRTKPLAR
jgi:hypothetical protein